jgi:peptide/nickel transport system ATP-binding protein
MGLHAPDSGAIFLEKERLGPRAATRSRNARRRLQIVFQNPYDSLNPRIPVRQQVARPAQLLAAVNKRDALALSDELLERVGLAAGVGDRFPSELSGGERQRVAIARALAAGPEILICDEATSALDVSVQATVLQLVQDLQRDLNLAVVLITHDLGVVASLADRVVVLENGVVREAGSVTSILGAPQHDYTRLLLTSAPRTPQMSSDAGASA